MRRIACFAFVATCLASPALAQAAVPSPEEIANRDSLTVAAGGGILPDYEGSDDYRFIPVGAIRGKYHGISFATRGTYLYVDVLPSNSKFEFDVGPIAGARFNSRKHIDDDVVKLLPNLSTVFEAGGFAGVSAHGLTNPYDTLSFRVDVLHGFGSDHNWTNFSPNIEFMTPLSRSTFVGVNVGAEFASNKYADYYFTITPEDSLRTGGILPPFNADGGLKDWKAGLLVNQSLSGDLLHGLSIFAAGQYLRLTGDFKRSPIVSDRGSASQWLGALGVAYSW
jgi:outer membrane scaffolding protein for murein synthesis (MipA/OmpV family)